RLPFANAEARETRSPDVAALRGGDLTIAVGALEKADFRIEVVADFRVAVARLPLARAIVERRAERVIASVQSRRLRAGRKRTHGDRFPDPPLAVDTVGAVPVVDAGDRAGGVTVDEHGADARAIAQIS